MASKTCKPHAIDFVMLDSDPEMTIVHDDIVEDLAKIGIEVDPKFVDRETYIQRERDGDFNILFSRTWGAPYDPHTYLSSWSVPAHVENAAIGNLEAPLTRELLLGKIENVLTELDPRKIQTQWREILDDIHQQAVFLPLWGTRVPYVLNRRFAGFTPSTQSLTYPLNTVRIISGSKNVTVAPGAGGALFKSVGPVNPHQYFPNQPFAQAWVYEGLLAYGQDGEINPALATDWKTEPLSGGGQRVTLTLREGVKFHDGSDFNCSVAKLNFDHVLSDVVRRRHMWFLLPRYLTNWECNAQDEFVLTTNETFYPILQELTYLRPLTIAAASAFSEGLDSDPDLHNSCEPGKFGAAFSFLEELITCKGLSAPIGTGPFKFVSRESLNGSPDIDKKVIFSRHDDYWGTVPDIEYMELQYFESTEAVEQALLNGSLDMALGVGPLTAQQVQDLKFYHSNVVDVRHSDVLQTAFLIMNTNKAPTDDITVRRAIIHAVDKSRFIEKEFAGLEQPVSQLLPLNAPFCNVDLNPKWSFDFEKAVLLNCPAESTTLPASTGDSSLTTGAIAGIAIAAAFAVAMLGVLFFVVHREKQGKPIFAPPKNKDDMVAA